MNYSYLGLSPSPLVSQINQNQIKIFHQNDSLILTCDKCFSSQGKHPNSRMAPAKAEGIHAKALSAWEVHLGPSY